MSTYAIGDVQGCYNALQRLLNSIAFDPQQDTLWFTGDLVNRGPESLATLRFIKNLGERHRIVLGNHDLHLLAVAHHAHTGWEEDTFSDILQAPDRDDLIAWLRHQPLLHHDESSGFVMVHAGLAPSWDLTQAKKLAKEVEDCLQSHQAHDYFCHMYGNEPKHWSDALQGYDRLRCITNYFTRVRFCYPDGDLQLKHKGTLQSSPENLVPWFNVKHRKNADLKIIFGHWAALGGITNTPGAYALDTGCIWGYSLTAMRLEDETRFSAPCNQP